MSTVQEWPPVAQWLRAPSATAGIRVLHDGEWRFRSYDELTELSRSAAHALQQRGLEPGDIVLVDAEDAHEFAVGFFAAMLAGGTPAAVPPPWAIADGYDAHVRYVIDVLGARFAICGRDTPPPVPCVVPIPDRPGPEPEDMGLANLAFVQLSSGSTRNPHPIGITHENIDHNLTGIGSWRGWAPDDQVASWLPIHHDMGLVGMLLASCAQQATFSWMHPATFLADPLRWLECFDRGGATLTAAPSFAFGYVARRLRDRDLSHLDLSGLRYLVVGAERIPQAEIATFFALLAPCGLSEEALMPAYGLAEATLAVTGRPRGPYCRCVRIDWDSLELGRPVRVLDEHALTDTAVAAAEELLVSCGCPLEDTEVAIVDAAGDPLPDGHLGEIVVSGGSVSPTAGDESGFATGDAGFVHGGELFVTGRMTDRIKLRGRTVHCEDVEARVGAALGITAAKVAAVPLAAAREGIVCVVEASLDDERRARALEVLRGMAGPHAQVEVLGVDRGAIPRTTSGKPRRRALARTVGLGNRD